MASYNARIDLDVRIEKAFANINKLQSRIEKIGQTPINIERNITREVNSAIQSFQRLGKIVRSTGIAIAGLGGAGALGSLFKTFSAVTKADVGAIGNAFKAVANLDNALINLAGNAPLATAGIAATTAAALAFAPQIARAAEDTIRLGRALGFAKGPLKALGEYLGTSSAEGPLSSMTMGFGNLENAVKAYRQALFETSETVSDLSRRQKSLQDNLNRFNSGSETAAKIAQKLVDVNARLNDELREQADLIRRASGVNVTELEASKGRQSIQTRQNAEAFRLKQLSEQEAVYQAIAKLNERDGTALQEKLGIQRNITNQVLLEEQRRESAEQRAATGLSRRIPTPYRTAGSMGFPVALPEIEQDRKIRAREEARQAAERALNLQKSNSLLTQGVTGLKAQVAIAEQLGGVYAEIVRSLERANDRQSQLFRARANRAQRQELGGENLQRLERINKLATNNVLQEQLKNKVALAGNAIKKNEFTVAKQIGKEIDQLLEAEDQRIDRARRVLRFRQRERQETRATAKERAKSRKEALSNAIIGSAFPLLFGQGAGAAVGGGAGGALGGLAGGQFGFGLSLVGTALGTAVDTFIGNIGKVADSLGDPTKALEAFEEAGFKVDDSIKLQVKSLLEAGEAYEAQSLVFKQISDTLGPNAVGQLNAYQQESEKLNDKYRELSAAITRELLPVLVGLLRVVNQFNSIPFFKELVAASYAVNPLTLGLVAGGAALKQSGEIAGRNAGSDVALSPELEAAAAKRAKVNKELENSLRMQVELSDRKLALSKINKKTDLDAWLVAQQQIIAQEYKIRNEEIYLRYKQEGLSQEIRSLLVQESMNQRSTARQKLLQDYRNTLDQINNAQEQADKKALDNAKRIARARNVAFISQAKSLKALFASSVALTKERDGELAAVKQRRKQLEQEGTLELQILAVKYKESAANAQSKQEADSLYQAYLNQYQTLVNTYELENLRTGQLEQQLSIYGAIASLSAAAGFQVSGDPRGAFVPKDAAGILKGIAGPSFEAGAELNAIVKQEVALARVLEKYQEIGQVAQLTSKLVTTGFMDMVTGTRSAEEVFADFLRNLAEILINTAQQMIAQYIAIGIARAFALGQSPAVGTQASAFNLTGFGNLGSDAGSGVSGFLAGASGIFGKANGGPVNANQPYIVGERGPELFVPFQQGSITSNEALQQAATTQVPFTRNAESVTQAQETAQAMRAAGPIEVRYESNVINGVEYVTAEQHRKGMAQAAERGRSLTIQALQNSVKTRGRVGL